MSTANYLFSKSGQIADEKKYVGIEVQSTVDFTVTNQKFSLVDSAGTIVVATAAADLITISTKKYQIKYLLNSQPIAIGTYYGIFEFDRDSLEHRIKKLAIKITA